MQEILRWSASLLIILPGKVGPGSPMKRPGQPAELAGIYVLLASNEDSYSTGHIYGAAGGSGGP